MLGPAYAIPILRKSTSSDLGKYVRAEFRNDECHWFTCESNNGKARRESDSRRSPLRDLFARAGKGLHEERKVHSSCALTLNKLAEEDPVRASGQK